MSGTVVITGASGGIGRATAELFASRGHTVYGLSRRAGDLESVRYISTDVTDEDSVKSAFERIRSEVGRIDLLINNAGFGISGATEFTSLEDAKRLFDVNFFGGFLLKIRNPPHARKGRAHNQHKLSRRNLFDTLPVLLLRLEGCRKLTFDGAF